MPKRAPSIHTWKSFYSPQTSSEFLGLQTASCGPRTVGRGLQLHDHGPHPPALVRYGRGPRTHRLQLLPDLTPLYDASYKWGQIRRDLQLRRPRPATAWDKSRAGAGDGHTVAVHGRRSAVRSLQPAVCRPRNSDAVCRRQQLFQLWIDGALLGSKLQSL